MGEQRRNKALAIKSCLDSLADDATRSDMSELAHFISLAALAAEDAAQAADPQVARLKAPMSETAGHC